MSSSPSGHVESRSAATSAPQPAFWQRLADHGDRPALISPTGTLSYRDLAQRVDLVRARLGPTPRLVLLRGRNDVASVIDYLACLSGGHPAILTGGGEQARLEEIVATYDPDVLLDRGELQSVRPLPAHELNPDLALLLSTSGSTGSPKLVRLSHDNLASNAAAIADFLSIRCDDVAITTLPLHYCFGLSVINSHLCAGGSVVLNDLPVLDPGFWGLVRAHRVTTFAGVPHTYALLDRVGFAAMTLPSLRYLTQAGGRMPPERVRRYAALGRARGWDLVVMYGQTEATARMAYLPATLAGSAPQSIGVPIPGGAFHLEAVPETDDPLVGELVYDGPNVMLGYATSPTDLAHGRTVHSLRTGDLARRTAGGLYEIVGRRSRIAKLFGLRVDLDRLELVYARSGHLVHCVDDGDRLLVALDVSASTVSPAALTAIARERVGLPASAVVVLGFTELPRLASGKPDYATIRQTATAGCSAAPHPDRAPPSAAELRAIFEEVLGRKQVTDEDSFVSLGGDSLSYVEASLRLEARCGSLPAGWHETPIRSLAASATAPPGSARRHGRRTLEVNTLTRALAIVAIVGSHAQLFVALGGAHVLVAVCGFNFARFHLTPLSREARVRHLAASTARIAVPSMLWIALVAALGGGLGWTNVFLLNGFLGPTQWSEPEWHYWYVEALVLVLLVTLLLIRTHWFDRLERRWGFSLPLCLAVAGLATRYHLVPTLPGDQIHRPGVVFWLFALGWAGAKSRHGWQRALVSALGVLTVPGFFSDPARELAVIGGLLLLVWVREVRVPAWAARSCGLLASASLYIYLSHWQVYPHFAAQPLVGTVASLAAGLALWRLVVRVSPPVERALRYALAARVGASWSRPLRAT